MSGPDINSIAWTTSLHPDLDMTKIKAADPDGDRSGATSHPRTTDPAQDKGYVHDLSTFGDRARRSVEVPRIVYSGFSFRCPGVVLPGCCSPETGR
jgi:hypothetical protein